MLLSGTMFDCYFTVRGGCKPEVGALPRPFPNANGPPARCPRHGQQTRRTDCITPETVLGDCCARGPWLSPAIEVYPPTQSGENRDVAVLVDFDDSVEQALQRREGLLIVGFRVDVIVAESVDGFHPASHDV